MMIGPRWEHGSAFPLVLASAGDGGDASAGVPFAGGTLFGSGRQALTALLAQGKREQGWTVAHLPTYYCPGVATEASRTLEVRRYHAAPTGDLRRPSLRRGDVLIAPSYFGQPPTPAWPGEASFVVDATHDPLAPWLADIDADYVFASLRKTLPLPDGGVVWSPRHRPLPSATPATDRHLANTMRMLSAMCLKAGYLAGNSLSKKDYLELFGLAEESLGNGPAGDISPYSRAALASFPLGEWRRRRIHNIGTLSDAVADLDGIQILPSTFGLVLRFDSAQRRDAFRSGLVALHVYPAVLWELTEPDVPAAHRELSQQLLFIHADFRYDFADLHRVAKILHDLQTAFNGSC
jgi:hypothetical protein